MTYRKYLRLVERRGHVREAIEALLDADAHDKSFFDSQEQLDALADAADDATHGRHRAAGRREQVVLPRDRRPIERLSAAQHDLARLRDGARLPDAAEQLPGNPRHQAADDRGVDRGAAEPEPELERNRRRRSRRRSRGGRAKTEPTVTIRSLDELLDTSSTPARGASRSTATRGSAR